MAVPPPIETRLAARPVTMFNQYLYFGSMVRPQGLAWDSKHRELWVADGGAGRVGIFEPGGSEIFSFASGRAGSGPSRVAIANDGLVALIDGDRRKVRLVNYRGEYRRDLELAGIGEGALIGAVCWDEDGNLYVGENKGAEVRVYRPDGSLKLRFGSRGTDEGAFQSICAIAIGSDGRIYVADQQALAVQVFDREGNFVRGWGRHEMGAANVSLPSGLAVDSKGRIFLADELRHQVKVYDANGQLLLAFGGLGSGAGQLSFPTDVVIDDKDRAYVSERTNGRVQSFELYEEPVRAGK